MAPRSGRHLRGASARRHDPGGTGARSRHDATIRAAPARGRGTGPRSGRHQCETAAWRHDTEGACARPLRGATIRAAPAQGRGKTPRSGRHLRKAAARRREPGGTCARPRHGAAIRAAPARGRGIARPRHGATVRPAPARRHSPGCLPTRCRERRDRGPAPAYSPGAMTAAVVSCLARSSSGRTPLARYSASSAMAVT